MKQYEMFELSFQGEKLERNWAEVDIQAEFTLNGKSVRTSGFYDGDGWYRVRYLPVETGLVRWRVWGCVSGQGEEECCAGSAHGPVQAEGTHFRYSDGSRYIPFGTTVYALAHQPDELVQATILQLADSPFNKVRLCFFPKHYEYNQNEPPLYPFEKSGDGSWDVSRPCIVFWRRFEGILQKLSEQGVEADLILFHPYDHWGFSRLTMEENRIYLSYLLRRLSAWPNIWWSLANEYDLMHWRSGKDWLSIEAQISREDPVHHLLSNHNIYGYYDYTHPRVTHCCLQSVETAMAANYAARYGKPVIFDEMRYEGNIPQSWGNLSAFELVNRFWIVYTQGAYATHGETYMDENDILWWAKGGTLRGESPRRIAWLRALMESLPGPLTAEQDRIQNLLDMADRLGGKEQAVNSLPEGYRPYAQRILDMPEEQIIAAQLMATQFIGKCGDDALLVYLSRDCASSYALRLPDGAEYDVSVLDVWEMTMGIVYSGVTGTVTVPLPGKEGIAVLARKVCAAQ